jgi:hypothetical protein
VRKTVLFALLAIAGSVVDAQLIVEDFDAQTTGSPPAWLWWNNGSSGTISVDETISRGSSGKSVELVRTTFDGYTFGFGRNFPPIDGPAELTFYFRVGSTAEEYLTAVGGNNSGHQVAWWVGVGGAVGNAIGTHTHAGGWNHVMNVAADTWYGVTLDINTATHTYDITVWENGNPGNTATETGIVFRDGSAVDVIDQIQFGNFSDALAGPAASAFVDDVGFVGVRILNDDFESGNVGSWSWSTRPRAAVTTCFQTVTTDAYLANDLTCDSGVVEAAAVELGASNLFFDLNGHTISGDPAGIGVRSINLEAVTIQNGRIENFNTGIDLHDTYGATIRDLMIGNLVDTDDSDYLNGIRTDNSEDVFVRDCFFDFYWTNHRTSLNLATSKVTADNIEVSEGGVAVDISGLGTAATIVNSRFSGLYTHTILAQNTTQSRIAANEFIFCETAFTADCQPPGGISGVTFEDNFVDRNFIGVRFKGGSDSDVLGNVIRGGWRGIFLSTGGYCPVAGDPGCCYATGNLISGNTATGNIVDLYHDDLTTGNTWTDNICLNEEGPEIPPCIPP